MKSASTMNQAACQRAFLANMPMTIGGIACAWRGVRGWSRWTLRRVVTESKVRPIKYNGESWYEPRAVLVAIYGEVGANCVFASKSIPGPGGKR